LVSFLVDALKKAVRISLLVFVSSIVADVLSRVKLRFKFVDLLLRLFISCLLFLDLDDLLDDS
jgi:hypothetical protein